MPLLSSPYIQIVIASRDYIFRNPVLFAFSDTLDAFATIMSHFATVIASDIFLRTGLFTSLDFVASISPIAAFVD